jgi:hypothetical protein
VRWADPLIQLDETLLETAAARIRGIERRELADCVEAPELGENRDMPIEWRYAPTITRERS